MSLPPGPQGHWLLGSMRELRHDPLALFAGGAVQYGDVVRYQMPRRTLIMVTNPDGVSHVLKERARNYTKMTHGVRKLRKLMDGVALADGEQWVRRRKLMNPAFRSDALAQFFMLMREAVEASLARCHTAASRDEPLDFSQEMSQLTLGIACRAFFGDTAPPDGAIHDAIDVLLDEARVRPYRLLNAPLWFPNRANRDYNRAVAAISAWARPHVQERLQEDAPRGDLLSVLLSGLEGADGLSMSELIQELQTFLVAAHDTTANAILWTLYYLSEAPELRAAVAEEATALPGGPGSNDDLKRLPLLDRVFNEALRLKSPAWILPRSPLEEDEICGFRIPNGCSVYISPYLTHRHPDHWPQPETFDPSRFEASACAARHPTAFIPFGAGPRQCLGREFAKMEALIFLSAFIARYHFDVISRETIREVPLVTLKPDTFRVTLRRRSDGSAQAVGGRA